MDLVDKLYLFELAGSFSSQSCFAAFATFFHPLMFLDFSFPSMRSLPYPAFWDWDLITVIRFGSLCVHVDSASCICVIQCKYWLTLLKISNMGVLWKDIICAHPNLKTLLPNKLRHLKFFRLVTTVILL